MQDSIDLFLGNYAVEEAEMNTTLHEPKDWKFLTVRTRLSCGPSVSLNTLTLWHLFVFCCCCFIKVISHLKDLLLLF